MTNDSEFAYIHESGIDDVPTVPYVPVVSVSDEAARLYGSMPTIAECSELYREWLESAFRVGPDDGR